jgi:hypothetical protein
MTVPMIVIGEDWFVLEGVEGIHVRFERNDNDEVVAAVAHYGGGMKERIPRQ